MKFVESIDRLIGNTPLVKIDKLNNSKNATIFAKVETFNPLSSVKDRLALALINDAEEKGLIKEGSVIVEPTSGNTGVGLSYIGAIRGYNVVLTMPESMSVERRNLLKALGAEVVLTPANKGMKGSIDKAEEIAKERNGVILGQFTNPANVKIHKETTAQEIWNDTDGKVDIFIAGVGTGGTITGVAQGLKEKNKDIQIIAVEPQTSAVLSGENAGPHKIQGIGAGFIPEIVDTSLIDEVFKVSDNDAGATAKQVAKEEGILVGISSGAALFTALEIAKRDENKGKNIVVLLPDTGERYLSTWLFNE